MIHNKTCAECGNPFETNRKHTTYCSDQCKKLAFYRRQEENSALNGNDDDDLDDANTTVPTAKVITPKASHTFNLDQLSQFIIGEKEKSIEFYKSSYEQEREKRKKLKSKFEAVEKELNDLKVDNRIKSIKDEKPTGLSGIVETSKSLFEHPMAQAIVMKLINGGSPIQMDGIPAGTNESFKPLIDWINGMSDETRTSFSLLVTALSKNEDPVSLTALIDRLTTIAGGGPAMGANGNANHSFSATNTGTHATI